MKAIALSVLGVLLSVAVFAQEAPPPKPQEPAAKTEQTPQAPEAAKKAPETPAKPAPVDYGDFPDGKTSIEVFYWPAVLHPVMKPGAGIGPGAGAAGATSTTSVIGTNQQSAITFQGRPKIPAGVILSFPASGYHNVRVMYFQAKASGNLTAPTDTFYFGTSFAKGDYLATSYTLRNFKVSYDFLSYPDPPGDTKWRFKTLWEVQGTWFKSSVDAPLKTDSSGNLIPTTATGTNWFIYPMFGVGWEYFISENARFEAKASGFAFPHHSVVWDADAKFAYRIKHYEIVAGVKAFHFKTSTRKEEYISGTMDGAYAGINWYPWWPK